jgi:hypothetical protein
MTTRASSSVKHDVVQVKNPRSGHYVKIDRTSGKILAHKQSEGAYKNIPVARKRKWLFTALWMVMPSRVPFQAILGIAF